MKTRHIILTITAAVLCTAPMAALAQGGPSGGPGWHGGGPGNDQLGFFEHKLPQLAEELGLSGEQLEKIKNIADTARPEIEKYAEQLRDERESYRTANDDPTFFDEDAFRTHAAAQHEIQIELMVLVGKARAEIFAQLTAEQIEQLEEMRGSFGGHKAHRHGDGRRSGS